MSIHSVAGFQLYLGFHEGVEHHLVAALQLVGSQPAA